MSEAPQPRFTGIFIPAEVLEMEELTLFEMLLLSWVDALYCPKHGGCYASNQYLGKKIRNAQENSVAKALTKLRGLGLIEDVSFDGRNRVIRATINRHIDKVQSKSGLDKNPIGVGQISNPEMDKNPSPSYIENKEYRKEEKQRTANAESEPAASDVCVFLLDHLKKKNPSFKSPKLDKWILEVSRIIRVDKRTPEQLKAVIAWAFAQQDDFWATTLQSPTTLRKLFDRAWTKMHHKSKAQLEEEKVKSQESIIEENRKWAKSTIGRINFVESDQTISISDNCVAIKSGREYMPIGYNEPQFKAIVTNKLKAWGYA